jgi:hypothetical protein
MDIKLAKQILNEAINKAFVSGVFNLVEAGNVTVALQTINEMPEFQPLGEPQPASEQDLMILTDNLPKVK